jgi:ABC-type uncharacterized transport system auxiliary subunit
MRRISGAALTLLITLILGDCGGGSRPAKYYTIEIPAAPDRAAADVHPLSLLVSHIGAPEILRDDRVVYRNGSNELGTYEYHRWAAPPATMVELMLLRMLRVSGKYRSVSEFGSTAHGDFVLHGRLYDFQEVDRGNITARVGMEFELQEMKSGNTVWTHFYSHDEPVSGQNVSDVVQALNRNLQHGLEEVTASLDGYFQNTEKRK